MTHAEQKPPNGSRRKAPRDGSPQRAFTIKDVARVAGVAVGTVSRVLNNNSTVMPEVVDKVLAAMQELNYAPNAVAQSMRAGSTRAIGCIVSDVVQLTAAQMITGAEQSLREAGYAMFVASSHFDIDSERALLRSFRQRQIDGAIVVISDDEDPEYIDYLKALGLPIVLWERDAHGIFNSVLSDHSGGCAQATAYLLGLGHQHIALVSGHEKTWVGREMTRGYMMAHAAAKVETQVGLIHSSGKFDISVCTGLMTQARPPTAIIATINDLAMIMSVARGMGLVVPRDLSLISVGDSSLISITSPAITVVRHNPQEVGKTAAEMMVAMLADPGAAAKPRRVVFPAELVLRESCAPPAKTAKA